MSKIADRYSAWATCRQVAGGRWQVSGNKFIRDFFFKLISRKYLTNAFEIERAFQWDDCTTINKQWKIKTNSKHALNNGNLLQIRNTVTVPICYAMYHCTLHATQYILLYLFSNTKSLYYYYFVFVLHFGILMHYLLFIVHQLIIIII